MISMTSDPYDDDLWRVLAEAVVARLAGCVGRYVLAGGGGGGGERPGPEQQLAALVLGAFLAVFLWLVVRGL